MAKLINNIKAAKFLKDLKEFDQLIKAIGECKSKAEEDRIISAELEVLKQRLNEPKIDKSRGREYMVRLIYCEMLGHDASFAYIKALQFASEPNIHTKKAAYLALTQLLDPSHELVLLLVNTLLSDLKSDNYIIVSSALVATTKLIGPDLVNAIYPVVVERLRHPKEHVRKKAIMVLHHFHQLDPRREGPLAGVDLDRHFRTMLCDKDPSVMSAALCALHEVIKVDPKPYKNLIPSFTSILKQVSEHRLPKSYDYHRFPAPFIQIKLLKVLALLGCRDHASSDNMYAVIQQTLRRANSSHTIGNALIFECVRTITTIYPNPPLLASAAASISTFLKSSGHNLRYVGIDALAGIVKINPNYAQEHQLAVIDCLEDPDDTLKLKTLELLYKMTKANNVEVIVEKMMTYLRSATDDHIRKDIVRKVGELAERYAPTPSWFIAVVSEVFELGGEHVEPQLAHNLMHLIAEQDEDLHRSAVDIYLKLLDKPKLPGILLEVVCWVLGEYGALAATSPSRPLSAQAIVSKLVGILDSQKTTDQTKALILTALTKLCAQTQCCLTSEAEDLLHKASTSQSVELQQRAYELQALLNSPPAVLQAALPPDASCEEFEESEMQQLHGLSFLDWYVQEALRNGAAAYVPEEQRAYGHRTATTTSADKGHLRFEAYETMPAAAVASSSASSTTHNRNYSGSAQAGDILSFASSSTTAPAAAAAAGGSRASSLGGGAGAPAAAAAASNEPQLLARGASRSKWGPAQFAPPERPAAGGAAAAAAPAAAKAAPAVDLLGGFSSPRASSQEPAASQAQAAATKPVSERDRLAASIFGGPASPTPAAATAKASQPSSFPAAAPAHIAPPEQPQVDLLDLGSPPRSTSAVPNGFSMPATQQPTQQPQQPQSQFDLLMEFEVPSQPAARQTLAIDPMAGLGLGGSLLGSIPSTGSALSMPNLGAAPGLPQASIGAGTMGLPGMSSFTGAPGLTGASGLPGIGANPLGMSGGLPVAGNFALRPPGASPMPGFALPGSSGVPTGPASTPYMAGGPNQMPGMMPLGGVGGMPSSGSLLGPSAVRPMGMAASRQQQTPQGAQQPKPAPAKDPFQDLF